MASNYRFKDQIRVAPEKLIEFAWSAPMRDLAKKVGISDVGLRKLLTGYGIVLPPQGHWNRVHAGRRVPDPPKPDPRRPGQRQHLYLDERFADILDCEPLASPDGPFASAFVPESLDDLREMLTRKIGRVGLPRKLDPLHPGLAGILKREQELRAKAAQADRTWGVAKPLFDNPVDQRRLRILNGLFWVLKKQGAAANAYEREAEIHAQATVGSMHISISLEPKRGRSYANRWSYPDQAAALPASTPLVLSIRPSWDSELERSWEDKDKSRIETCLADIVVETIVGGEAAYRRSLRQEIERIEHALKAEAEAQRRRLAQANEARLKALRRSGELLRQAQDIRSLIASVEEAVTAGEHDLTGLELKDWVDWAHGVANEIDPVKSGQVKEHLRPPKSE
ncbi:hypothetical protein [Sphingobium mellinum]|uniref:hypothetical protein n=1 Tax=Sphingobium mellinum TaxID=1387166 RepID=UPI0030EED166